MADTTADFSAVFDSGSLGDAVRVDIASLKYWYTTRHTSEDVAHIRALATSGRLLAPIIVHRSTMRIIDGVHRLRALELRGRTQVAVQYFDGSEEEAFILAVHSNTNHGRPLTFDERSAAAQRILVMRPQWSDRLIGSVTALSAHTVAVLRRQVTGEGAPEATVGRDGRIRPSTTEQNRLAAARLLSDRRELSLRQVAAEVGISPNTVRDVRDRLARGEHPVPARYRTAEYRETPDGSTPDDENSPVSAWELASAYRNLCRDPAMRGSENGRRLLRMLAVVQLTDGDWGALSASIPGHCEQSVRKLAGECASRWMTFGTGCIGKQRARN